jgi:hypothetical protein
MASRTLLVAAPVALGVAVLAWPVLKAKGEPAAAPARPGKAAKPAPAPRALLASPAPAPSPAAPEEFRAPANDPATAAIQSRVRELEARLRELEARRDALAVENGDLERTLHERHAESTARVMAEWRVRGWEKLLGLSDAQKRDLLELAGRWAREDRGRPAGRDLWAAREGDLRSRLTSEQAAKLHQQASDQAARQWSTMGRTLGSMVGASKEDQARLQQAIGSMSAPSAMLLPEAHGADWAALSKEAAARIRPLLSGEQAAKLDSFVGRN